MTKKELCNMIRESTLSLSPGTAEYCRDIENLLFCKSDEAEIEGLTSIEKLKKCIEEKSYNDEEAILKEVETELKTWLKLPFNKEKDRINSAKKTVSELDGETFLSLASIAVALILLVISIISTCTNYNEQFKFWSAGNNGFWNTAENGDTITMFVTGIVMMIGGIFFLTRLFVNKKQLYYDAQQTLADAGISVKTSNFVFKIGKKNIIAPGGGNDNIINTGNIKQK